MAESAVSSGQDKVNEICNLLRNETLEPAIEQAKEIVGDAEKKRDEILKAAHKESEKMISRAQEEIEKRQAVFQTALSQGARQATEWLRQEIEERLIRKEISKVVATKMADEKVIADLIQGVIKALEKDGIDADLSAAIAASADPEKVNELIGKKVLDALREKSVVIGLRKGGVEIKLHKEEVTLVLSDEALSELICRFLDPSLHIFFFGGK